MARDVALSSASSARFHLGQRIRWICIFLASILSNVNGFSRLAAPPLIPAAAAAPRWPMGSIRSVTEASTGYNSSPRGAAAAAAAATTRLRLLPSTRQTIPLQQAAFATTSTRLGTASHQRWWGQQWGSHKNRRRSSSSSSSSSRSTSSSSTTSLWATIPQTSAPFASVTDIGPCIGTGSYGTVHYITALVVGKSPVDGRIRRDRVTVVGKRAWTVDELKERSVLMTMEQIKDKATRCQYYWSVELHCLSKIPYIPGLPEFLGTVTDDEQRPWMLFDVLEAPPTVSWQKSKQQRLSSSSSSQQSSLQPPNNGNDDKNGKNIHEIWRYSEIAPSLQSLMERDRVDAQRPVPQTSSVSGSSNGKPKRVIPHHLYSTSQALLLGKKHDDGTGNTDDSLAATLDVVLEQILEILTHVHSHAIVHRDIKPSNVLVAYQDGVSRLVLIDFGSAGDLSTAGMLKKNIGISSRVAISPIYAAPELYIDDADSKHAVNFDCFSTALLYLQLLFQYLDERTEAGFHQQLSKVQWNLDAWLNAALQSKVRPAGLEPALQVLEERPGLWKLLQDMLRVKPDERLSSTQALARWIKIRDHALRPGTRAVDERPDPDLQDGPFLRDVLETLQVCEVAPDDYNVGSSNGCISSNSNIRPLHFVATFDRLSPMGLYLAEMDGDVSEFDDETQSQWQQAMVDARPGDVFVMQVIPDSQADQMGIFAVGDRLHGIGELPLGDGGYNRAVEMIENQPSSVDYVTLHFDRKTAFALERNPTEIEPSTKVLQNVSTAPLFTDQGAWSYVGRRASQEDGYFVHDVRGPNDRSVLLAGVFDGHAGSGASGFVQSEFPAMFSNWLNLDDGTGPLQSVLDTAWNQCCEEYRTYCQTAEECIAEYDDVEGVLKAYTGFNNVTSGTTATMLALDQQSGLLTLLNCGDSRGLVIDPNGELIFQTSDHTPQSELERLKAGVQQGLTYSVPECSLGQWIVKVGPFQYKLGRALEGSLITSFGITSLADFSVLPAEAGMIAMVATDGLWEVMDSAEVSRVLTKMKKQNMSASDAAKSLCAMAYNKASNDNISIVVVFL